VNLVKNCKKYLDYLLDDPPIWRFIITCFSVIAIIGIGSFLLIKIFRIYSDTIYLHERCLLDFKESPRSKLMRDNIPKMEIIKEDDEDEEEPEEEVLGTRLNKRQINKERYLSSSSESKFVSYSIQE
jgi:hypothetical protein